MKTNRESDIKLKKAHVIFISDVVPVDKGASSAVLYRHLVKLDSDGFSITLLLNMNDANAHAKFPDGWDIVKIPMRKKFWPPYRASNKFLRIIRWKIIDRYLPKNIGDRPSVIVSINHGSYLKYYALHVAEKLKINLLFFYHDREESLSQNKGLSFALHCREWNRRLSVNPLVKRIWAVSKEIAYPEFSQSNRVMIVPPLPHKFNGEVAKWSQAIPGSISIVHIGTIYYETLSSFHIFIKELRKVHGRLIIYSQNRDPAEALVCEYPNTVEFRGFVNDSDALLDLASRENAAFLVIYPDEPNSMPWSRDSFPSKFVQMVQTGLPGIVVAPDATAIGRWCKANAWLLHVEAADKNAISEKLRLLGSENFWKKASQQSISASNKDFDISQIEKIIADDILEFLPPSRVE